MKVHFEWDEYKDRINQSKHGVSFQKAIQAFLDSKRVIARDVSHSQKEGRYYCMGRALGGILTVRFTCRRQIIRIIGAGFWRKGKKAYEEKNKI